MASSPKKPAAHPHALPWVDDHVRLLAAQTIPAKGIDYDQLFSLARYVQSYGEFLRFESAGKRAAANRRYRELCVWARFHVTRELSAKWHKIQATLDADFDRAIEHVNGEAEDEQLREAYQQQRATAQAKHDAAEKRLLAKHGIPDTYP